MAMTIDRRAFGFGLLVAAAASLTPVSAFANARAVKIEQRFLPQRVRHNFTEPVGTIIVAPRERFLYLLESPMLARRYGIGVGKAGLAFKGSAIIERKAKWPSWRPTPNMIKRDPQRYAKHAGGVAGGPNNPLGARALYLYRNGRDTYYRIHGTNEPWTIGKAVSNGCIRMVNDHVRELYELTPIGTRVVVM
ncbi:ErfK/YbiS/YcfS/YnhG [Pannonibacter phragmitetus]|uniref:L,D-transpeptidase n=1 Tax=Stappiaceae TaxID=2821832 RepID=UPI00067E3002|nr:MULTISPECIES: L,D-transpeptidase [Stappiaceae]MAW89468.1 L,D-transpeptidase [Phyllobacteriaceae bacterium]KND16528.1 ErfK/YbiS/YcfS/YnhG [Pannonibacter phragmitetus]MAA98425.1 L,D-transpeptidase [Stappia sp.]MBM19159.1 L,D-transpeptidase [Stappia sp.]MBM20231.1 L,D-transpeptidase [Stappia sp.]|tara:strand:- start:1900 stop:2475 length:576 start_codon:yes stop_codon:yes gene_type:complete